MNQKTESLALCLIFITLVMIVLIYATAVNTKKIKTLENKINQTAQVIPS